MAAAGNLEFQNDLLKEISQEDCLVVMSRGLWMEKILIQLLQVYSEPSLIVFVLNTSSDFERYVIERLRDEEDVPSNRLPKSMTFDTNVNERQKLYSQGGTFFITSRILVVDLLLDRVPIESVSGIIVWDAHTVFDSHQESFILRLFRSKNTEGFIKAFSQFPSAFSRGFASVDRCLRNLFADSLLLWPRTRKEVVDSLESRAKPDVIEYRFNLTPLMRTIQFALLDLITMTLKDLKNSNPGVFADIEDLDVEHAVTQGFGYYLRKQFEPVWYQLSPKTKRIIDDINILRRLLFALTDEDCVSFSELVDSVRQSVKIESRASDWVFYEPAQTLFAATRDRLISSDGITEKENFELNAKWVTFCEIISELREEAKKTTSACDELPVLIIIRHDIMTDKLKDVLDKGPEVVLKDLYIKTRTAAANLNAGEATSTKKQKLDLTPEKSTMDLSMVLQELNSRHREELNLIFHATTGDGYIRLQETLVKYKPKHVIMFDPDVESIRRLEIYQATFISPAQIKLYFLIYEESAEEQRYLTALRKEKDAFALLTEERDHLIIRAERNAKSGIHPDLERSSQLSLVNNRKKKKAITRRDVIDQRVIVDIREFRSELPSLLHKRGIDVIPVTIEIGDYVLSPEMCVERKAINDLISSLSSGRLFSQVSYMTRHYKKSLLLIEFEEKQEFGLTGKISFDFKQFRASGADTIDTVRKLCILTITFPQLRLIWSPSPDFSADMFEYLKQDKEQPDVEKVVNASNEQLPTDQLSDQFDIEARDFLLSLPGVTVHNVYRLMKKYLNVVDLMSASLQQLTEVMMSENKAKSLYDALHSNIATACVNSEVVARNKLAEKFKGKRKAGR